MGEPADVEVVGRLIEQKQVVAGRDHPCQPNPVALAHRHRPQGAPAVGDRPDLGEGHLEAARSVPGVEQRGRCERFVVALRCGGRVLPERLRSDVELSQRRQGAGQELIEQIADGAGPRLCEHELLPHEAKAAVPLDAAAVGYEIAAERLEEGGLPAAVLADHGEPVPRREGEVHPAQQHAAAAGEVEVPGTQVRGG